MNHEWPKRYCFRPAHNTSLIAHTSANKGSTPHITLRAEIGLKSPRIGRPLAFRLLRYRIIMLSDR